jgi:DNA primase
MDVIALHRAGFTTAVAPLGTALTEAQLQELWRLAPEPVLCFDGDAAGQRAAVRALGRALPLLQPGRSLRFATLPAGEDPDSLLRRGGRDSFAGVLGSAQPLSAKLWEVQHGARPVDTPERRAELERRLMEDVSLIADRAVQAEYRRFFREQLFQAARLARPTWRGAPPRPVFVHEGRPVVMPQAPGRRQRELLLRMLLQYPYLIEQASEEIAAIDIPEPELDRLRREILEVEALRPGLDAGALRQHLEKNRYADTVDRLLLSAVVHAGFLSRNSDAGSVRLALEHVLGMIREGARGDLAIAADALAREPSPETWDRFLALQGRERQEDFAADGVSPGDLLGDAGDKRPR